MADSAQRATGATLGPAVPQREPGCATGGTKRPRAVPPGPREATDWAPVGAGREPLGGGMEPRAGPGMVDGGDPGWRETGRTGAPRRPPASDIRDGSMGRCSVRVNPTDCVSGHAAEVQPGDQLVEALRASQVAWQQAALEALDGDAAPVAHPRLAHRDGADARLELALRQVPVADELMPSLLVFQVREALQVLVDLGSQCGGEQVAGALPEQFGQHVFRGGGGSRRLGHVAYPSPSRRGPRVSWIGPDTKGTPRFIQGSVHNIWSYLLRIERTAQATAPTVAF